MQPGSASLAGSPRQLSILPQVHPRHVKPRLLARLSARQRRHHKHTARSRHSICAGKQGKFWAFHDLIYDHQEELSTAMVSEMARKAGLDEAALALCLADSATETQLQKEIQWGELVGLNSTPTVVINGRKLEGAKTPADMEALLQSLESQRAGH